LAGDGQGGGGGGSDIFDMFFGGGRRRGPQGPQKGEDLVHTIKASLEDLYNGKTVRLAISRNKPCTDCEGRGGKVGCEKSCSDCNGRGIKVMMRQLGPGMVQQMQVQCSECKGAGKSIDERDKCKACKGNKVFKDRKVLEVNIEKGMKHGSKIKFSGEADEIPGTIPGDVVIVVQEKEHEVFKRKEADLVQTIDLQLSEALCGFTKVITHLDGRSIKVQVEPGQVIKQDQVKVIAGEGMPYHGNPFTKGKLFLHFTVNFPKTLPVDAVTKIRSALPAVATPMLTGEEEEASMQDIDISQFGKSADRSSRSATDEDDEDGGSGGAQRVQCGQA
jgi:DnaJ family protein A protein 2